MLVGKLPQGHRRTEVRVPYSPTSWSVVSDGEAALSGLGRDSTR